MRPYCHGSWRRLHVISFLKLLLLYSSSITITLCAAFCCPQTASGSGGGVARTALLRQRQRRTLQKTCCLLPSPGLCLFFDDDTKTSIQSSTSSLAASSSSSSTNESSALKNQSSPPWPSTTTIINAALLIAGTTVGGGFLALPAVVASTGAGFVPAAMALMGVWAYFVLTSWSVVECLITKRNMNNKNKNSQQQRLLINDDNYQKQNDNQDVNDITNNDNHPGMVAAAQSALGRTGGMVVVVLLALLVEATLVSQISRAGSLGLFSSSSTTSASLVSAMSYRTVCVVVALVMAGLVFGPHFQSTLVPMVNSALTILFGIMAVVLFGVGAPVARWSNLRLGISATATTATSSAAAWLPSMARAIPTFLQLLVYGEILPTVCQLLHYHPRAIRTAIGIGSVLPLILEIGWAALGMALVPLSSTTSGRAVDPVTILLQQAGPVQIPLWTLAITAISTTIIGSYLALQSMIDDLFPLAEEAATAATAATAEIPFSDTSPTNTNQGRRRRRRTIGTVTSIVAPALGIACISPDLFLTAIDFAGSYPVLLLWGVTPPVICLRQRWRQKQQQEQQQQKTNGTSAPAAAGKLPESFHNRQGPFLPSWGLWGLTALSLGLFAMSAAPDVAFLIKGLSSLFVAVAAAR